MALPLKITLSFGVGLDVGLAATLMLAGRLAFSVLEQPEHTKVIKIALPKLERLKISWLYYIQFCHYHAVRHTR